MEWIAATLITAAVAFVTTNIDDIVVLAVFFSMVNGTFRRRHVVAGQYLGFTALVVISLVGFVFGRVVPHEWIGLLGLLPIAIGIRKLSRRNRIVEQEKIERLEAESVWSAFLFGLFSRQTFGVTAVTVANGGDNIGIYTPLFASSSFSQLLVVLGVFFVLVGVWCYLGYRLARHPAVARGFARGGHLLVPFVLIALGIYILIESGTHKLLGL